MTYRAGIDLGGTNARVEIFDQELQSLGAARERIRDQSAPEEIAVILADLVVEACQEASLDPAELDAVGVGLAGQLAKDGRTVANAPNLGWRDVAFAALLTDALADRGISAHTHLANDLNAQLVGEARAGAARGFHDVLAVYVGTGVGGALLCGGRLITGAGQNAGEIGHSKVVLGGRPCGCGEEGCVEAYAGGIHLERRLAGLERDDLLRDGRVHLGVADEMALETPEILAIWEEATTHLALVVANAVTLLNPGALLLGGGVLENCDVFRSLFLQKAIPLILGVCRAELQVEIATLGDQAGMLGAVVLAGESTP